MTENGIVDSIIDEVIAEIKKKKDVCDYIDFVKYSIIYNKYFIILYSLTLLTFILVIVHLVLFLIYRHKIFLNLSTHNNII